MSDYESIRVTKAVFQKLQRLAALTGDENSAIERLIKHWESGKSSSNSVKTSKSEEKFEYWHSPTGDVLRVGEVLRGTDAGKMHEATVERHGIGYNGVVYDSPSAAARAVKHARGLHGTSASTNGRDFWRLRDPETNRWVPISSLRPAHRATVEELLAELDEK
ncbi:MAG TPA: hypothetical protein VMI15_03680 [Burkholderiales bacterium]|nr:hypothetical protein [Burkholderiales bacterium]